MRNCRSLAAVSGLFFVQKYCRAFNPATGMPVAASTEEISLSILAQPPSPLTKTTSVSELAPAGTATSTTGSFGCGEAGAFGPLAKRAGASSRERIRVKRVMGRAVQRGVEELSSRGEWVVDSR